METLNFTQTNKIFEYENDDFKITGTVGFQETNLEELHVEIYSKGDKSGYAGHLDLKKNKQDTIFDFYNVPNTYIDGILVAIRSLLAKLEEDLNLNDAESK